MAWSLEAASAGNSLVQVSTSCADVLSLKCIGKDFHLLVTNAHVTATVSVTAVNPPYLLVLPESGECTVSLGSPATYTVKKQQSKEDEKDREPEASGKIIMFRPDFDVRSDAPDSIAATGVNELTDNFTATVNVVPNGIATLNGHSPEMTVVAVEKGTKINHDNNFNISVSVDEDSNLWPTSKTLWYGIEDGFTGCCHSCCSLVFKLSASIYAEVCLICHSMQPKRRKRNISIRSSG